ncbi:MAG: hypothetical protein EBT71_07865 [Alphaproteobacteria bacterium]|nr:hypothetical protein [Alphaproteobacteria bacterium]
MTVSGKIFVALSVLLVTACASPSEPNISLAPFDPEQAVTAQLPAQDLQPGGCGLFLWGTGNGRPLQFFQHAKTGKVDMPFRPGAKITRLSADELIVEGFFARQSFQMDELRVDVDLRAGEGRNVLRGIPISAGQIGFTEPSGRQTYLSVIGLFGCRNRQP